MSAQSCTPGYIWERQDLLGRGATSEVFLGLDRETGDQYAVKVFKFSEIYRNPMFNREVDLLKTLDHENIVKFMAMESLVDSPDRAIVMEYCAMGSLHDVLLEPENYFGLDDQEFLLLLDNVVSAMEFLKQKDIVHRDIKPANILKTTSPDGRKSFYKFSDFGTAKKLRDREKFNTLVGTEEYIHPDMLAEMLNGSQIALRSAQFRKTVDLWSTGATLYHAATGRQPFQPYGGRDGEGPKVLLEMTSKKDQGVISGVQLKEGSPIIWSKHLPSTCRLTKGLQKLITPMIAGLEERDDRKMWTFDRFFGESRRLLDMDIIKVFDAVHWQLLSIYLHRKQNLDDLRDEIASQSNLPPHEQVLLWEYNLLDETDRVDYVTSHEDPVLLLPSCPIQATPPSLPRYVNPPGMDMWGDDKEFVSMAYSAAACVISRLLDAHCRNIVLADKTMRMFNSLFHTRHENILKRRLNLLGLHQALQAIGKLLQEACGSEPAIQQRLDAVNNLLKGIELPDGMPEWMTEPSSSVQEELEYTVIQKPRKPAPRIMVTPDVRAGHGAVGGEQGALGVPGHTPQRSVNNAPPSSFTEEEKAINEGRTHQQRMSRYMPQQQMHSNPQNHHGQQEKAPFTEKPSLHISKTSEQDKPVTPIIARRRFDAKGKVVTTGRKTLNRRTRVIDDVPHVMDAQKKQEWLHQQDEPQAPEPVPEIQQLSPKSFDLVDGRAGRISSTSSELGETIEYKYTLTSIPTTKVLKAVPADIKMPHQERWFERSECVVNDLKKVNETILREYRYVSRRSEEFNTLHHKRLRNNVETLFSSVQKLINNCMDTAVLPMFNHLQDWLSEMKTCLDYARDHASPATLPVHRNTGRLDQAQRCCDIIIREMQHTMRSKLSSNKIKREELTEALDILLEGLDEET